jgi:uncharacterized ferritin-like protein (DUF455 family)
MNEHREHNVMDQERQSPNAHGYLRPIDTAQALQAFVWHEYELSRLAFGWMPAIGHFAYKTKLARFGYLHSRNCRLLYERVKELPGAFGEREGTPPLIRESFERISQAPSAAAFFAGYAVLMERIYSDYERFMYRLDALLDAPTVDQLRIVLMDRTELLGWLAEAGFATGAGQADAKRESAAQWSVYCAEVWRVYRSSKPNAARLPFPVPPAEEPAGPVPSRSVPDPAFPEWSGSDLYRKAYSDPAMSPLGDSIKQMHYINATEIGAAESLCYLYYGVQRMPLTFYFNLARHLWDEARHSEMGVRRLKQLGYRTEQFQFFNGSPGVGIEDIKKEWFPDMYAGLTMVSEPCSFIKKRKSAEKFWEFGDALSAIHCEFDMADERMHVDFGKLWGPELYKQIDDMITARDMAERARKRRLRYLDPELDEAEIEKVAKNFPGFCGLSTVELTYDQY